MGRCLYERCSCACRRRLSAVYVEEMRCGETEWGDRKGKRCQVSVEDCRVMSGV